MTRVVRTLLVLASFGLATGAAAQSPALTDMVLGRPDAPVTVIEYASMTCPHCAEFHQESLPGLKSEYIDTGKVRFIYRDFPLDGWALRAAMIARCAGPDRFFAFADVIYRQQKMWTKPPDPLKGLEQLARLGGMSSEQVKACLENKPVETYVIESRMQGEREFKVSGTPTLVVNGKVHRGVETLAKLKEIIDPLLAKAGGS